MKSIDELLGHADPNTGSAAQILHLGEPCKAVIVEIQPLGIRNAQGDDLYAFKLTVAGNDRRSDQIQVASPVPTVALPLLYPGNTVPAKRMRDDDEHALAIDWQAAQAQLKGNGDRPRSPRPSTHPPTHPKEK